MCQPTAETYRLSKVGTSPRVRLKLLAFCALVWVMGEIPLNNYGIKVAFRYYLFSLYIGTITDIILETNHHERINILDSTASECLFTSQSAIFKLYYNITVIESSQTNR